MPNTFDVSNDTLSIAIESPESMKILIQFYKEMIDEYEKRFGKDNKTQPLPGLDFNTQKEDTC